jgi:hypothetical protein
MRLEAKKKINILEREGKGMLKQTTKKAKPRRMAYEYYGLATITRNQKSYPSTLNTFPYCE